MFSHLGKYETGCFIIQDGNIIYENIKDSLAEYEFKDQVVSFRTEFKNIYTRFRATITLYETDLTHLDGKIVKFTPFRDNPFFSFDVIVASKTIEAEREVDDYYELTLESVMPIKYFYLFKLDRSSITTPLQDRFAPFLLYFNLPVDPGSLGSVVLIDNDTNTVELGFAVVSNLVTIVHPPLESGNKYTLYVQGLVSETGSPQSEQYIIEFSVVDNSTTSVSILSPTTIDVFSVENAKIESKVIANLKSNAAALISSGVNTKLESNLEVEPISSGVDISVLLL
ncbi:MAG: hypothetical protein CR982_03465 [Candidatus Cloacimonadota bacterium]|nr:MAG: hypothetical protein CR982_03465 [Candidatus Cloacimonadota bacterium]